MKDECKNNCIRKSTDDSSKFIDEKYGKTQIHVRDINLFYIAPEQGRNVLIKNEDIFFVRDTPLSFSQEELNSEMHEHPERFSPNVAMRPLYQCFCLPDAAYVGGPAEIAYWLQLRPAFEYFHLSFPILALRNSVLISGPSMEKLIKKTGLDFEDFFLPENRLKDLFLERNSLSSFPGAISRILDAFQEMIDESRTVNEQI